MDLFSKCNRETIEILEGDGVARAVERRSEMEVTFNLPDEL